MIPSHVLILGAPLSGKLRVCNLLTDLEEVEIPADLHSGVIIPTTISTKYYSVELKILVDEYPETRGEEVENLDKSLESLQTWKSEFISPEMVELRDALDGLVFCVNTDDDNISESYLQGCLDELDQVRQCLEGDGGEVWSGFFAVVGTKPSLELEDLAISNGFEYVTLEEHGINEFKEKIGRDRIIELFESHEWLHMDMKNPQQEIASSSDYTTRQHNKLGQMTQSLLNENEDDGNNESPVDLSVILEKLQIAKSEVEGMDDKEKELHAQKVIEEVMNYL